MKKQKLQLAVMAVMIVCALVCLLLLQRHNESRQKEEAKQTDRVIDAFEVSSITAFSYETGGTTWSYEKTGDGWICKNNEQLSLDESKIESLLGNVGSVTASDELLDVEDFGQYGLDQPSNRVTIVTDDQTVTYSIGDYNSIVYGYYVRRNDEDHLYIVSGGVATAFTGEADEYALEEEDSQESGEE